MKKLSSDFVMFYRVVSVLVSLGGICVTGIFMVLSSDWPGDFGTILIGLAIAIVPWFGHYSEVTFDDENLYVSTLRKKVRYDLRKVKTINGCYGSMDPTFQIEFYPDKGSSLKIDYIPPRSERSYYLMNNQLTGRAKAFEERIHALGISPDNNQ